MRSALSVPLLLAVGCLAEDDYRDGGRTHHVFRSLGLARPEGGRSPGFDLDAWTSTKIDQRGCRQPDYVSPEGQPGVDNQFAEILPLIDVAGEGALAAFIQNAIDEGRLLIMPELREYGPDLNFRLLRGADQPLLGTDGRILENQTLALDPEGRVFGEYSGATFDGATLFVGPMDVDFLVVVFEILYQVRLQHTRISITFDETGVGRGVLAGAVDTAELRSVAKTAGERADIDLLGILGTIFEDLADLNQDPTGVCRALSMVATFETVPVFTY
ncbi:MAG: hypothetical protein HY791_25400 [Deltaproteobacteria bacterium]|nr:hypothetical protein [Deltaproteobacteria bacterium]